MNEHLAELLQIYQRLLRSGAEIPLEFIQGINRVLTQAVDQKTRGGNAPSPQIPAGADLLWILSGGNPDAFISYLHSIPDPALNALSRNPTELQRTIGELSRRITMPHGEVEDTIPKADLQSSNVYGFSYNPGNQHLYVRFNSGSVYEYNGVPARVFKIFASGAIPAKTNGQNRWGHWWRGKVPSLGASFYNMIREGGYPYQRVA